MLWKVIVSNYCLKSIYFHYAFHNKKLSIKNISISAGELEMSNVDLSGEFTSMITTQRGFQANSRVITTSDTLLEELINLKR